MKTRLFIGVVLLLGAAYFAVFGGEYNVFELRRVRAERALEEQRAADARADVASLRARRDSLASDSATIERVAREQFGLIREGERLYRFADSAQDSVRGTTLDSARRTPRPVR